MTLDPTIVTSGALYLLNGAAVGGTINFSGTNDLLYLSDLTPPANTISGFAPTDTIDFRGLAFDEGDHAKLLAGNILQITTQGGATYDFHLAGTDNYAGQSFHLASDGAGGTDIVIK